MTYEIPKNLKYEEKIIFNLSIWQALWVGLFGFLIVTIFYRLPLLFEIKVALAIILSGLGLGFAFLDFYTHAKKQLQPTPQRMVVRGNKQRQQNKIPKTRHYVYENRDKGKNQRIICRIESSSM